jgi:hypothetical protein
MNGWEEAAIRTLQEGRQQPLPLTTIATLLVLSRITETDIQRVCNGYRYAEQNCLDIGQSDPVERLGGLLSQDRRTSNWKSIGPIKASTGEENE